MEIGLRDDDDDEVALVVDIALARPSSCRRRRSLPPVMTAADHGTPQNPPTPLNTALHMTRTAYTMSAMLVVFASRGPEEVGMYEVSVTHTLPPLLLLPPLRAVE